MTRPDGRAFRPSLHGFRFPNRFPVPGLGDVHPGAAYGLCGGMAAMARSLFLAGKPVPVDEEAPRPGSPLHRALVRHQVASLGGAPFFPRVGRFLQWTRLPDPEVRARTAEEALRIRRALDEGGLVQVGLVHTDRLTEVWHNHQVLAWDRADADGDATRLRVYDPNRPLRDDVTLRLGSAREGDACAVECPGGPARGVRGFFVL